MFKPVYAQIAGTLTGPISAVSALIPVDLDTIAKLAAEVDFGAGQWTYLTLRNSLYSEEVRVTALSSNNLIVERGTSGSTPQPFGVLDTRITNAFGLAAIQDVIAANPSPSNVTVSSSGIATTQKSGNNYNVNVTTPNFTGEDGIAVMGSWPNIRIGMEFGVGGCCPGEGGGGSTLSGSIGDIVLNSSILQGTLVDGVLTLSLAPPVFTGSGGITVTGAWPNYTIGYAGSGTGGGVEVVAVAEGLSLTGNPAVNPTLSITNTGVTPGNYAGVEINARGQIEAVPVGWAPISTLEFAGGVATVNRTGSTANVIIEPADVGQRGVVALADSTQPLDPNDDDTAVTPKLLATKLGSTTGSSVAGNMTGEATALYTNALTSTGAMVTLAAGEKLMLVGDVVVHNADLSPAEYGIAVRDLTGVVHYASKICKQSKQGLVGVLTGPLASTTLAIVTTELPAGATVQGAYLGLVKI